MFDPNHTADTIQVTQEFEFTDKVIFANNSENINLAVRI